MNTQWFLGAQTARGFISKFDDLHEDSRIRKLIILKGGPGCGKSTFMKKLLHTAQQLGADTESYPCASDPDSLDGILILPLGLAVVDGTAPHVMEPELCGCGESYLNLGCFYDTKGLAAEKDALQALQKKYRALFPGVYAHLNAAEALRQSIRSTMKASNPAGLHRLMEALGGDIQPSEHGSGIQREVFFRTYTPSGENAIVHGGIAVVDPWGLCAPLFARLQSHYLYAGYDCICALSPLAPKRLEGIMIPELHTTYFTCEKPPADSTVTIFPERFFTAAPEITAMGEAVNEHLEQAMTLMKKAKQLHDEMELRYRPYVSFEGLELLTQEYQKTVKADLLSLKK